MSLILGLYVSKMSDTLFEQRHEEMVTLMTKQLQTYEKEQRLLQVSAPHFIYYNISYIKNGVQSRIQYKCVKTRTKFLSVRDFRHHRVKLYLSYYVYSRLAYSFTLNVFVLSTFIYSYRKNMRAPRARAKNYTFRCI